MDHRCPINKTTGGVHLPPVVFRLFETLGVSLQGLLFVSSLDG